VLACPGDGFVGAGELPGVSGLDSANGLVEFGKQNGQLVTFGPAHTAQFGLVYHNPIVLPPPACWLGGGHALPRDGLGGCSADTDDLSLGLDHGHDALLPSG
jgi:hypothetical protein